MKTLELNKDKYAYELKKRFIADYYSIQRKIGFKIWKKRLTLKKSLLSVLSNYLMKYNAC